MTEFAVFISNFLDIQIPFSPLRGIPNWNFMGYNSNSDTLTLIWYGSEGFFSTTLVNYERSKHHSTAVVEIRLALITPKVFTCEKNIKEALVETS